MQYARSLLHAVLNFITPRYSTEEKFSKMNSYIIGYSPLIYPPPSEEGILPSFIGIWEMAELWIKQLNQNISLKWFFTKSKAW